MPHTSDGDAQISGGQSDTVPRREAERGGPSARAADTSAADAASTESTERNRSAGPSTNTLIAAYMPEINLRHPMSTSSGGSSDEEGPGKAPAALEPAAAPQQPWSPSQVMANPEPSAETAVPDRDAQMQATDGLPVVIATCCGPNGAQSAAVAVPPVDPTVLTEQLAPPTAAAAAARAVPAERAVAAALPRLSVGTQPGGERGFSSRGAQQCDRSVPHSPVTGLLPPVVLPPGVYQQASPVAEAAAQLQAAQLPLDARGQPASLPSTPTVASVASPLAVASPAAVPAAAQAAPQPRQVPVAQQRPEARHPQQPQQQPQLRQRSLPASQQRPFAGPPGAAGFLGPVADTAHLTPEMLMAAQQQWPMLASQLQALACNMRTVASPCGSGAVSGGAAGAPPCAAVPGFGPGGGFHMAGMLLPPGVPAAVPPAGFPAHWGGPLQAQYLGAAAAAGGPLAGGLAMPGCMPAAVPVGMLGGVAPMLMLPTLAQAQLFAQQHVLYPSTAFAGQQMAFARAMQHQQQQQQQQQAQMRGQPPAGAAQPLQQQVPQQGASQHQLQQPTHQATQSQLPPQQQQQQQQQPTVAQQAHERAATGSSQKRQQPASAALPPAAVASVAAACPTAISAILSHPMKVESQHGQTQPQLPAYGAAAEPEAPAALLESTAPDASDTAWASGVFGSQQDLLSPFNFEEGGNDSDGSFGLLTNLSDDSFEVPDLRTTSAPSVRLSEELAMPRFGTAPSVKTISAQFGASAEVSQRRAFSGGQQRALASSSAPVQQGTASAHCTAGDPSASGARAAPPSGGERAGGALLTSGTAATTLSMLSDRTLAGVVWEYGPPTAGYAQPAGSSRSDGTNAGGGGGAPAGCEGYGLAGPPGVWWPAGAVPPSAMLANSLMQMPAPLPPAAAPSAHSSEATTTTARAAVLERYREKKRRRGDGSTVRYHTRQVNAVARPRIKGRFAKPGELAEHLAHEQDKEDAKATVQLSNAAPVPA